MVAPTACSTSERGAVLRGCASVGDAGVGRLDGLQIRPGMAVEVFVRTGERSLLNYLFKPLFDRTHVALGENEMTCAPEPAVRRLLSASRAPTRSACWTAINWRCARPAFQAALHEHRPAAIPRLGRAACCRACVRLQRGRSDPRQPGRPAAIKEDRDYAATSRPSAWSSRCSTTRPSPLPPGRGPGAVADERFRGRSQELRCGSCSPPIATRCSPGPGDLAGPSDAPWSSGVQPAAVRGGDGTRTDLWRPGPLNLTRPRRSRRGTRGGGAA